MMTAAENQNSSSESVVSLSYSDVVSFENVNKEEYKEGEEEEYKEEEEEEAGGLDDNEMIEANSIEFDNIKLSELFESPSESEVSGTTIEEIKHFPSPTPAGTTTTSIISNDSSWSDSIEAFLDQINDIDFDSDYQRDILLKRGLKEPDEISEEEQGDDEEQKFIDELRIGQGYLLCLAVPVLLSQILMLLILTSTTSNAKSSIIVRPIGQIQAIHYHHYHHYEQKNKNSGNGFVYVLFNPFGAIYNSRAFKITAAWISKEYHKQVNDPSSFVSQLSHYVALYLNSVKNRLLKLNGVIKLGLDNEIGKALRIRDSWNRAVYDKIYKIASTPQYQRTVSTISKWAAAIKNRLFS
jgi:hypothetical protein